jgi:predicted transcriptional regulator
MFRLEITSLHEFRVFIKLIKNEPITEEEIAKLLPGLEQATADLKAAEEAQK